MAMGGKGCGSSSVIHLQPPSAKMAKALYNFEAKTPK